MFACNRAPGIDDPALPGIESPSTELTATLAAGLARQGPAYRPHTRHLLPDGRPRFTNRLILESSPYLLQHAHNPVNWYAWGDEAFERARREHKLVMLSVGYSTCHWCHVMERESFEDEDVARLLNEHFICIKVDREERPDLDEVYQRALAAIAGGGGWPMTVFALPDRRPFFGGTYFPRDRFVAALRQLQTMDPAALADDASRVVATLQPATGAASSSAVPGPDAIARAERELARTFDGKHGGFGGAPKFPRPASLDLLLRYHRRTGDPEALWMVAITLEHMASGGMHDQLGGGFHRYSTDVLWRVPHYEKMLYDQAQLALIYLDASQVTGRADFADVARGTLDYMLHGLQLANGGFAAATDADSPNAAGADEEGAYFTWTRAELDAVLGPETGAAAAAYYGVGADPAVIGGARGSVLYLAQPTAALPADVAPRLLAARDKRPPPHLDDKLVVAWNGLAIAALARGAIVLSRPDYATAATRAAQAVLALRDREGHLARSGRGDAVGPRGVLADHAFVIAGLLELAQLDPHWLDEALALQHVVERDFGDPLGGYFDTAGALLGTRDRSTYDGAEPSGNAVELSNLVRLAALTADDSWRQRAEVGFGAFADVITHRPGGLPAMLSALDAFHARTLEIALAGDEVGPLLDVVRRVYLPDHALAMGATFDATRMPWLEGKHAIGGRATAFVCERGACKLPTSDPAELERQLRATK